MNGIAFAFAFGSPFDDFPVTGTVGATFPTPAASLNGQFFIPTLMMSAAHLVQWLRGDLGSGTAGTWTDQSGAGNTPTQAVGADQPGVSATGAPNGHACLTFSGSQWLFLLTAVTAKSPYTFWIVMQCTVTGFAAAYYIGSIGAGNGFGAYVGTNRAVYCAGAAVMQDSPSTTSWEVWEISNDGATTTMRAVGAAQALTNSAVQPLTTTAMTTVGAGDSIGASPFAGNIAEIITCNIALASFDANDVSNVRSYLTARYGLAA